MSPNVGAESSVGARGSKTSGRALRRGSLAIFGIFALAMLAPWLSPYDPQGQDLARALSPPSTEHLLGTDALGRDVLSRCLHGARVALVVGLGSVLLGGLVGGGVGLLGGYFGGMVDALISRILDTLMILPPIIVALVLAALLGGGVLGVSVAVAVALVPAFGRVIRSVTLTARNLDFVHASRAVGASPWRILWRHVAPQCAPTFLVLSTLHLGYAILGEAALSFLGVGISPPQAAWGAMVSDGYRYLTMRPLLSVAPGLAIVVTVLAFNQLSDALRPRAAGRVTDAV